MKGKERQGSVSDRELLDAYVFRTLDEVPQQTLAWQHDYNHHRPYKALGYRTPAAALEPADL